MLLSEQLFYQILLCPTFVSMLCVCMQVLCEYLCIGVCFANMYLPDVHVSINMLVRDRNIPGKMQHPTDVMKET